MQGLQDIDLERSSHIEIKDTVACVLPAIMTRLLETLFCIVPLPNLVLSVFIIVPFHCVYLSFIFNWDPRFLFYSLHHLFALFLTFLYGSIILVRACVSPHPSPPPAICCHSIASSAWLGFCDVTSNDNEVLMLF
jgi:hypothetical protein